MKKISRLSQLLTLSVAVFAFACATARAQDDLESSWTDGWFVRGGARLLLNAKASVSMSAPPASATMYDNGHVLPDISGDSGFTWNWGYTSDSQVSGNQLNFTRLDNTAAGTVKDETGDTEVGGELIMGAEMGRFRIGRREARFGFEIGYGYNPFSLNYSGVATGAATYTQAGYDLGGSTPPEAPYSGTFNGPGMLLNTTPTSSSIINSASQSAYTGELDSSLHNMKLGVWLDVPVGRKLLAGVSFGYSSLFADTELTFTENSTFSDPGIPVSGAVTRTISESDWNPGVYVGARVSYLITRQISAYVSADYQYNGRFEFSEAGRDVTMDFTSLFAFGLGVSYTF